MPASARSVALRFIAALALPSALPLALPSALLAQASAFKPALQWELRADALAGPPAGGQLGFGANVAADSYVRVGIDLAGGLAASGGGAVSTARADFITRYLFDPFKEISWGPYAGGGFSAQWDRRADSNNWRGDLLVVIGVEGPAHSGWRTSIELGLGGGARLGVVLRRARSNGR